MTGKIKTKGLINLTPHVITIKKINGEIFEIPSHLKKFQGKGIGRISFELKDKTISNGFIFKTKKIKGINLPDEKKELIYIVSLPTLLAVKQANIKRLDLVAPDTDEAIRDERGNIVYIEGFLNIYNII